MRISLAIVATVTVALGLGALPAAGTTTPWATQQDVRLLQTLPGATGGRAVVDGDRLYVGAYGLGLRIFDASDPRAPVEVGTYAPPTVGPYDPGIRAEMTPDAVTWDDRRIVALMGSYHTGPARQTEFLDVTDPANPVLLRRVTMLTLGASGTLAREARLWLPTGGTPNTSLRIYDASPVLATPSQPPAELFSGDLNALWRDSPYRLGKLVGGPSTQTRDVRVYEGMTVLLPEWEWEQDAAGVPQPTYAQKDILVIAAVGANVLPIPDPDLSDHGAVYVIDITEPTAPVVMSKWQNDGGHPMHDMQEAQLLDGDPGTLVVTDRDDLGGCDSGRLYTVGVSEDLLHLEKLGEWAIGAGQGDLPLCAGPRGFTSHDRLVYLGASVAGVQVLDLRDPADPVRVGRYVTEGADYLHALHHEGVIYAGDHGGRGLDLLEFLPAFVAKAVVHAANPASSLLGHGISEDLAACDPDSDHSGVDGLWVEIPDDRRDGDATLSALGSSPLGYDLDIRFFDEGCSDLGEGVTGDGGDTDAQVPEDAAYAYVQLVSGPAQWLYVLVA